MREIKFRAWDSEKNEMYKPIHEGYKGSLFELLVDFSGELIAHTMQGMEHESLWKDRFKLMQFTGLKDKNGKEIYEGDIVMWGHLEGYSKENIARIAEVKYNPDIQFHAYNIKARYEKCGYVIFNFGSFAYTDTHKYLEVIGDIYENPELIDKI